LGKETDALLSEDTLICRCEDITWGELQAVLEDGARDLNTIKRWTRIGMGRCQGRNCEPTLAYLVQKHLNVDWADVTGFTCRFPIKPIPLSALSAAEDQ
jgi:NAD(P)H-nitrite reductase large subunit